MPEIYVDADACPVKDEIRRVAERHQIAAHLVSNRGFRTSDHPLIRNVLVGDKFDEADNWIVEHLAAGDIVITGDIQLADRCRPRQGDRTVSEALRGADVVIGVSTAGAIPPDALSSMAEDAIVFALANPEPEVDPVFARRHAAVVATGRSDHPNQINNVLAFPGIFRGLLDTGAGRFIPAMAVAASRALADLIPRAELRVDRIIPDPLDDRVVPALAQAITSAAVPTPRAS